jgi:hypothetical protein
VIFVVGQSSSESGFLQSTSIFPCQSLLHQCFMVPEVCILCGQPALGHSLSVHLGVFLSTCLYSEFKE